VAGVSSCPVMSSHTDALGRVEKGRLCFQGQELQGAPGKETATLSQRPFSTETESEPGSHWGFFP
jgi:hypothetical protein